MGILEVFDSFFEDIPAGTLPGPGHIYWVPVPNTDEVPRILDVQRATPDEHWATHFEIVEINHVHFSKRARLPIKKLTLGLTEELIIAKGKKRPAVILSRSDIDVAALPAGQQQRMAKHLGATSYLMAPLYSTSNMREPGTFGPALVARIRALQYTHLFCLPEKERPGFPGSIVRLDRVFPTFLGRGCAPWNCKLADEPLEVVLSQFSILCGGVDHEPYDLVRELVQDALPEELA